MTVSGKAIGNAEGEWEADLPGTGKITLRLTHPAQFVTERSDSTLSHIHDRYEIYVYLGGEIGFVVHDRIFALSPGDAVVTAANTYHHSIVRKASVHEHYCLLLKTEDPEATRLLDRLAALTHLHSDAEETAGFLRLLKALEDAVAGGGSPLSVRASLYALLAFLENSRKAVSEDYPEPLAAILRFVGENASVLRNVEEIAAHFFISIASLERLFARHLRTTPSRYLLGIRLATAKRLLDSGMNVTEAALRSGFPDCSHFIQRFRKEFGVTPNRYRAERKTERGTDG